MNNSLSFQHTGQYRLITWWTPEATSSKTSAPTTCKIFSKTTTESGFLILTTKKMQIGCRASLFFAIAHMIHEVCGFTAFPVDAGLRHYRHSLRSKICPISQFSKCNGCCTDRQEILLTRAFRSKCAATLEMGKNDDVDQISKSLKEDAILIDVFKKYSGWNLPVTMISFLVVACSISTFSQLIGLRAQEKTNL